MCFSLCLLFSFGLSAQMESTEVNKDALLKLKTELSKERKLKEARIKTYLKNHPQLKRSFVTDGSEMSIIDIRNDHPVYYITHNDESVRSLGVYELRAGGKFGIDIGGENTRIGVWDRGLPLASHAEFQGRLQNSDAASEFSFHSTHVAGTILAGGLNPSAKGFCYRGTGRAFDWFQDTEEMIHEVLMNDMLVSNHSYGVPGGWNGAIWLGDLGISDQEDYRFGYYDNEARAFDDISFNAPFYSIVASAGNERGDSGDGSIPPDGPYDCITGFSTGKNVFTVGAVNKLSGPYTGPEDVVMSSFSSWGPLDDGRIKPDFVAPGVNLLSSSNETNQSYGFSSGTSMSSPSVAGAVALINEAYFLFNNTFLRSASLKAVLIHTAHEAGRAPGPDYEFGWGLVSADNAVEFIQNIDGENRQLHETSLDNGSTFEIELNPVQGQKITATLVWTDPAGVVPPRALDPTDLILVNDLDMLIEDDSGNSVQPWILNPLSPEDPATRGDNFRDNVEKIEFESPDARPYTLKISHKGNLFSDSQSFSLLIEYTSEDEGIVNYYWINGEGDWSDTDSWSDNSGGNSINSLPTENAKLIIDDNSFPAQGGTIFMDDDYHISGLVAFSEKNITLDLGGYTLTIEGTTLMAAENFTIKNGTLLFSNSDPLSSNVIDLNDSQTQDLSFSFPATNAGTWSLSENDFSLSKMNFEAGEIAFQDCNLQIDSLELNTDNFSSLDLSETDFDIDSYAFISNVALSVFESTLNVDQSDEVLIQITDMDFPLPIEISSSSVLLDANGIVASINAIDTDLTILRDTRINRLSSSGPGQIIFENASNLTVTDLVLTSAQNGRITLSGENGASSFIEIPERTKLCFDYLDINNVDLKGIASVSVGQNSILEGSSGWFVGACENLLFADFDTDYLCAGGFGQFVDNSEGDVSERRWFIQGEEIEGGQLMEYYFEDQGTYEIRLEIFDSLGNSDNWSKTIDVEMSELPENRIIQNPTQLASLQLADAYQWYNFGLRLEGETDRVYRYEGEPGIYWVLTFDDNCNRRSEILDLTSSVIDLDAAGSFVKVFPNPVSDLLCLEFEELPEVRGLKIYDSNARLIKSAKLGPQSKLFEIDFSGLIAGDYYLILTDKENSYVKKILKI